MKRHSIVHWSVCLSFLVLALLSGCGRQPAPVSEPPTPSGPSSTGPSTDAPAPTIELQVSPSSIQRGSEATLTWNSSNAESVRIDSGVGNVSQTGSLTVSPRESTTYTAIATGGGGDEARASARLTVAAGADRGDIREDDVRDLRQAIEQGRVRPIFFAYDSAELSDEARMTLEENAKWFRRFPDSRIIVEGHCDERGTEEYNLALGDRRAQSTVNYLAQLGVDSSRLEPISYGEERPLVQGHNEAAWSKNRRAQFAVR